MGKDNSLNRRSVLGGIGLATAAGMLPATTARSESADSNWDYETEVLCVGSGAAAGSAAVTAASHGAKVMLIEKMPLMGGTTGKSGGVAWICNHNILREQGIQDKKRDAIAYMAHYSYPQIFNPESSTFGLEEIDYKLIEAFYDNGYKAIEHLEKVDAVKFKQFRLFQVDVPAPDYADHLPENKVPTGRALEPAVGSGSSEGGGSLAAHLEDWLARHDVPMMTDTRVTKIITNDDRVIGVEAKQDGKIIRIRASKGVIFGTGGYSHNEKLVGLHQTALYGACAMPGSTGDFISLAGEIGAQMGAMHTAWRSQVVFEEALQNRLLGFCAFVLPGDSMILVNKYGKRIVNEKRCYNDRTMPHFVYDPAKDEYPNQLQFMLFDERSIDRFGGAFPFPLSKNENPYLISGQNLDELFENIDARLKKLENQSGGVRLADNFGGETKATIERFNGYAKKGVDPEFERGKRLYDTEWHKLFSYPRADSSYPANPMPNLVMHPFSEEGPYYCFILAAGALDTNSGPRINEKAQVLASDDKPISGLYGAGNCIASPSRSAYYGAGGTIGLALTYGYIAGRQVAKAETV
ncbi:FAD-dependent oxidoreductase [Emcibacter sp.]|uniref:FAD-dependent oxidoreductase n=1 Tax=Emcibacter sp. TaxID=1979954 RepID=UPI002AA68292|nr:FAD-dependent oxidoreductase [Emcibacter sp.]